MIPLIFVNSTADVVILSQPTRRYNESVAMIEELRKLGKNHGKGNHDVCLFVHLVWFGHISTALLHK